MKLFKGFLYSILVSIFFMCTLGISSYAQKMPADGDTISKRTIKVGFFEYPGFNEIDEKGNKSGYGYELIEMLKTFTGWEVEYVSYEDSWSECFNMLENKELDLVLNVYYTDERAKNVKFSDYPIINYYCSLSVRDNENRYNPDDLTSYFGAVVGFLKDDFSFNLFTDYARDNNFPFTAKFYASEKELHEALVTKNEIDMIASKCYRSVKGEKNLEVFSEGLGYAIFNTNNKRLSEEFNSALSELLIVKPNCLDELSEKYFSHSEGASLFTVDEIEYIKNNKDRTFNVLLSPGMAPMCSDINGEVMGIIPDIIALIGKKAGLNLNCIPIDNHDSYYDAFEKYGAEIRGDAIYDFNTAEEYGYTLTIPYSDVSIAAITRSDYDGLVNCLGYLRSPDQDGNIEDFTESDMQKCFDSVDDAVNALLNNDIDIFFLPYYTGQLYASSHSYSLELSIREGSTYNLCLGVSQAEDKKLASILTKAISEINEKEIHEIISGNLLLESKPDLFEFLRDNPFVIWTIVVAALCVASILAILTIKASARKRESKLAFENSAYFKSVLSTNLFAIRVEIDEDDEIRYFYAKNSDSSPLGISIEEIDYEIIKNYRKNVHPEDRSIFDELISLNNLLKIESDVEPYYKVMRVKNLVSENYIYISVSVSRIESCDSNKHLLAVIKDVDLIKREDEEKKRTLSLALETAKQYSASKTMFLSKMSHDIRTPMNAIFGMSHLARLNIDDKDKVLECLDIIDNSSEHLIALLNDILDMSKVEAGSLSFNKKKINIKDCFDNAVSMHLNKIRDNNIEPVITTNIRNRVVVSDSTRIEQVFSNIISNACKYTPPGGNIYISLEQHPTSDLLIYDFKVRDTGIGMDEDMISNIFKPFERAKEVAFIEGSGLGMAITKNIVDALGGEIFVKSKKGVGTEITVSFAFNKADAKAKGAALSKSKKKKPVNLTVTGSGKRALIVEDVEINALFASSITEMKGFKTDVAYNGEQAVKMLEASDDKYYSIVLMDIQMPKMNGIEATKIIRNSERDYLKNIPIIAMSANVFDEDVLKYLNAGMNDHIAKPVDIHRFSEIVDKYIKE